MLYDLQNAFFRAHIRHLLACIVILLTQALQGDNQDVIINEIHYHPASGEVRDEFIELYNRGTDIIDLTGWSLSNGVSFIFPEGARILPDDYLVVAQDAAWIQSQYGIDNVIGDYTGVLADGGEQVTLRDALGESIEGTRYDDRLPYPVLPDGLGPSLERVNPFESNDFPGNWAASLAVNDWIQVVSQGEATSSRLYLYLNGAGEVIVDDITITAVGDDTNTLDNGGFENGMGEWTAAGNHAGSRIETGDTRTGGRAMRIIASGAGGSSGNSINTYTDIALVEGNLYRLTFWVKFISTSSSLVSRLSGSGLLKTTGYQSGDPTPGRRNSSHAEDIPAFISDVIHTPLRPVSDDAVAITATVTDNAEDPAVTLHYDKGQGEVALAMMDDGQHGDGEAGDGVFGAMVPSSPANTEVRYRITARDAFGNDSSFPYPGALTPVRGYYVEPGGIDTPFHVSHFLLTANALSALSAAPKTEVTGTYVHDGIVYPDVAIRYRGHTSIGNAKKHWKVKFKKDHRLAPIHPEDPGRRSVNVNSSWNDKTFMRSLIGYQRFKEAGHPYCEVRYIRGYLNGSYLGFYTEIEQVNEDYLRRNGMDPDTAILFKSYTPCRSASISGFEYRAGPSNATANLSNFVNGIMNASGGGLDDFITDHVLLDMFTRYQAVFTTMNSNDHIHKNHYIVMDGATQKWFMLPWDIDLTLAHMNLSRDDYQYTNHILHGCQCCSSNWNGIINSVFGRTETFRQDYHDLLAERVMNDLTTENLWPQIEALREQLRPEVVMDRAKWGSFGSQNTWDFDFNVDKLVSYVVDRRENLLDQLAMLAFEPLANLTCTRDGDTLQLTWDNPGGDYEGIRVLLDGEAVATLPKESASYDLTLPDTTQLHIVRVAPIFMGGLQTGVSCILPGFDGEYETVVAEDFNAPVDPGLWAVNGTAKVEGGQLVLTESTGNQAGAAFLKLPFSATEFKAEFDLEISQSQNNGADGMTFAMLMSGNPAGAVGGQGGGLGITTLDAYALEFDTWSGNGDPSENHVGLIHGGDVAEHFATGEVPIPMDLGGVIHASVFGEAGTFWVKLTSPGNGMPETTVLIGTIPQFPGGDVFFGFTAATGGAYSRHIIDNFILKMPRLEPPVGHFLRGDVNDDGGVDLSDAVKLLMGLFSDDPLPVCRDSGDANDDGNLDLGDAIFVLSFLFDHGPIIPPPYPDKGSDPTEDDLPDCE